MKDTIGVLSLVFIIIVLIIAVLWSVEGKYSLLCEYSKYKTKDFKVINGKLYCKSSEDSYQKLKRD